MIKSLDRIRNRFATALRFASAAHGKRAWFQLALAGLARHRPFGDRTLYSRIGAVLSRDLAPAVWGASGLRVPLDLGGLIETTIFEEIFLDKIYPLEDVPFAPDLVVDCGACTGMFTLLALGRFPKARFVAFEPDEHNHARLRNALAINHARVEARAAAVGVDDGELAFEGGGYGGHFASEPSTQTRRVKVESLPRYLQDARPRRLLLKIDIEGAERELLPAIVDLLPANTVLFLETHYSPAEVDALLAPFVARGFTHRLIRERHEDKYYLEHVLVRHGGPLRHYCTYFDYNHASFGLALHASLRRHSPANSFVLWVLCLDDDAYELLERLDLPEIRPVRLAELEQFDPELAAKKNERSRVEYIFTTTPCWPRFLLAQHPEIELITYLDADLWFTSSPEDLFTELGPRSVAIVPHRFPSDLAHLEKNGRYNVGWLSFRRTPEALACLDWWRERCLDWCHLHHEPGKYADQKYLDRWPDLFTGVAVLANRGANLALWNLRTGKIDVGPGGIRVDGEMLIFFHFHGLRRPRPTVFCLNSPFYRTRLDADLRQRILQPYADEVCLLEARHGIRQYEGGRIEPREPARALGFTRWRALIHMAYHRLIGNYVVAHQTTAPTPPVPDDLSPPSRRSQPVEPPRTAAR